MFISVDLPDPDEPMMATKAPLSTVRSTPRKAWTSTESSRKVRSIACSWIAGSAIAGGSAADARRGDPGGARLRRRPGAVRRGDHPIPDLEAAAGDLHVGVVVQPGADRHGLGPAVQQDPDLGLRRRLSGAVSPGCGGARRRAAGGFGGEV